MMIKSALLLTEYYDNSRLFNIVEDCRKYFEFSFF